MVIRLLSDDISTNSDLISNFENLSTGMIKKFCIERANTIIISDTIKLETPTRLPCFYNFNFIV